MFKNPLPKILALGASALVALFACAPDIKPEDKPDKPDETPEETPAATMTLDISEKSVDPAGDSFDFNITTEVDWTIENSSSDWISLSRTSGSGNGKVNVVVEKNKGDKARNGLLIVNGKGCKDPAYLTVSQDAVEGGYTETVKISASLSEEPEGLFVSWEAVPDATGYVIEYRNTSGEAVATGEAAASVTSYNITANPVFEPGTSQYVGMYSVVVKGKHADTTKKYESDPLDCGHSHFANTSGSGKSASSPYEIVTQKHLSNMSKVSTGYFALKNDITMEGSFTPISKFSGVFDGGNHKIINLKISGESMVGLFAEVSGGGTLKNIYLENPEVEATTTDQMSTIGTLCAVLSTTDASAGLYNCHTKGGKVTAANKQIGGLVGRSEQGTLSNMTDCTNDGTEIIGASTSSLVGGLIGITFGKGTVKNCWSNARVSAYGIMGGLTGGVAGGATFSHCYCTGVIENLGISECNSKDQSLTGGLVPRIFNGGAGTFEYCWFTGEIKSNYIMGGITGRLGHVNSTVHDCYCICKFTVSDYDEASTVIGGISGTFNTNTTATSTLQRCYAAFTLNLPAGVTVANIGGISAIFNTTEDWPEEAIRMSDNYFDATLNPGIPAFKVKPELFPEAAKTTAELHQASTFAGWDFTDVWTINGDSYPTLR